DPANGEFSAPIRSLLLRRVHNRALGVARLHFTRMRPFRRPVRAEDRADLPNGSSRSARAAPESQTVFAIKIFLRAISGSWVLFCWLVLRPRQQCGDQRFLG